MSAVAQPKLFISYAHADGQTTINNFWSALRGFLNTGARIWEKWDDKEILVGQKWDRTIGQALENGCNCCLLLISDLFCNSSYIIDKEWPKTLSRNVEQGIAFFPVVFGVLERGLSGLPDQMHQFQVYWPTVAELYSAPPHNISNPDQVRLCYKDVIDNEAPRHRFLSRLAMQMNKRFDEFLRDQATKSQSLEREGQQAEAEHKAEEEHKRREIEARRESDEERIDPRAKFTTKPSPSVASKQELTLKQEITDSTSADITAKTLPYFLTLNNSSPFVKKVQHALKKAGFDPGKIDGVYGRKTKSAVIEFQKINHLFADGIVGPLTAKKLGVEWPK